MMTRQNYQAMADQIADQMEGNPINSSANFICGYARATVDMANRMADVFAADNPRFDRERFLKACGL